MWRSTLLALAFLLLCPLAFSQSTTVSGQITDAGAQAWNNGTYTFTFLPSANNPVGPYTWTGGTLNTTISGSLTSTGSYSVSIPSNSAISPVGSAWSVKFCPQASSICFYVNTITITGGTQTLNATPPAILISLQTAIPPVLAYSTSEITGAAIGSQFYLLGAGNQVCAAVSGNNILTSASAHFLTNAVGGNVQTIFCTNLSGQGGTNMLTATVSLPQTTIQSVDSDTQIHTVGNANANAGANSHCYWGTLTTSAWKAIWSAATAVCGNVVAPAGVFLVDGPEFNTIPASCAVAFGSDRSGIDWIGQGIASTVLVPVPGFSRTNPNGDSLGISNGYFWSKGNNINVRNVTVDCGGQSAFGTGPDSLVVLQSADGNNASMDHVHLMACGGGIGNGLVVQGGVAGLSYVQVDGSGGICLSVSNTLLQIWGTGSFFGDCGSRAVVTAANTVLKTSGVSFCNASQATTGECINIGTGVIWDSIGDNIFSVSTNTNQVGIENAGGTITLRDTHLTMNATNNIGIWNSASGSKTHLCNLTMKIQGTGSTEFLTVAGSSLFDDCPNALSGTALGTISGNIFNSASATGTACATGNFALTSGWGTSSVSSVAANGDTHGCHVTITGAAGSAGPVLTWTYPTAPPLGAPASCHLSGGVSGTLTGVTTGTPGTTSVAYTFAGTPSAQTYVFDVGCP